MFGEINPKMIGKINFGEFTFPSLALSGNTPSYNAPTNILSAIGNVQFSSGYVQSANNTLDDGTGNMTVSGPNLYLATSGNTDPIFHLRRGNYSTRYTSRIRLSDDNPGGTYWEIGNDISGSTNTGFYIYGQGTGGGGAVLQAATDSSLKSAHNTLDDGSGGSLFGVDSTPTVIELQGIINIGVKNVNNTITIGGQGSRAINFGNNNAIVACAGLTFQINTGSSGTTSIGNNASTTNIVGPTNINTSGSSAVNIGTSSYTGTVAIGNASVTAVNLLGTININTSGSNSINIGTSTYTGQITIGNTSNNLSPLIQGGTSSNAALTINSTSGAGCYMYVNRSSANAVAFGSAGAAKPVDIYDFSASASWLYNNGTHGFVGSANNTLDDGTGQIIANNTIFSKSYSVARWDKGFYLNDGTGVGGTNYLSITTDTHGSVIITNQTGTPLKAFYIDGTSGGVYAPGFSYESIFSASYNSTTTLAAHDCNKGVIVVPSGTGAITLTFPTGTNLSSEFFSGVIAGVSPFNNQSKRLMIVNQSANTVTVATNTGITLTTSKNTIAATTVANFVIQNTGTNTFTIYGGN